MNLTLEETLWKKGQRASAPDVLENLCSGIISIGLKVLGRSVIQAGDKTVQK